ncbi:hypothetical protein K1719_035145 [Acacia pycnantha]|nr:hypothetical protein K1719_035145 [Acacia pycnantha]
MRAAGIEPDVVSYTTAIKVQTFPVCVESQNFEQPLSLYEEMKRYKVCPNLVSSNPSDGPILARWSTSISCSY